MKTKKLLFSLMLLCFAFGEAQAKTTPVVVSNDFKSNWSVGAGVGALIYLGDGDHAGDFSGRIAPAVNVNLNKWVTPWVGVRLEYTGVQARGYTSKHGNETIYGGMNSKGIYKDRWTLSYYHFDLMVNAMNLFGGYKEDRLFSLIPYTGFGLIHNGKSKDNDFGYNIGLQNNFNISKAIDLNLDLKGTITHDRMDSQLGARSGEGFLAVTVGMTYKFGKRGWKQYEEPKPCVQLVTAAQKRQMEQQLQQAESDNGKLSRELAAAREELAKKPNSVKEGVVSSSVVFFEIGSTKLSKENRVTLSHVAKTIKQDESGKKYIVVGYADKSTGSASRNMKISQMRSQAVYDALIEEFGVSKSQLDIEYKGGVDDMFYNDPSLSRVVIIE